MEDESSSDPTPGSGSLNKERGVWVFCGGRPIPASATDKILQKIRDERDRDNLGRPTRARGYNKDNG
jgi:hypothetical protein